MGFIFFIPMSARGRGDPSRLLRILFYGNLMVLGPREVVRHIALAVLPGLVLGMDILVVVVRSGAT